MPNKAETKKRIQRSYAHYVTDELTVSAACKVAAAHMVFHERQAEFYRDLRNDMSTNLGCGRSKFDPAKHTHGFANL